MSFVPKESIEVVAQSIGINNLTPDVAASLAPKVEYRLCEIMQVRERIRRIYLSIVYFEV